MIRKQLYIEARQDQALKDRAKALGISEAELMRRALDAVLYEDHVPRARVARALDAERRPRRWVGLDHLARTDGRPLLDIGLPAEAVVRPTATLGDTLNEMLTARYASAIVVDSAGSYLGIVDIETINEAVRGMRAAERSRLRDQYGAADNAAGGETPSLS
jgi:hypothetical protein